MNDALELAEKLQREDGYFGEYVEYAVFLSISSLDIGMKVWIDEQKTKKVPNIKDTHRFSSLTWVFFGSILSCNQYIKPYLDRNLNW